MTRLILLLGYLFTLVSLPLMAQSDSGAVSLRRYYSDQRILEFARFLWNKGDFLRAATEYQRYLFTAGDGDRPSIHFAVGRCYLRASQPELAVDDFRKALELAPPSAFRDSAAAAFTGALLLTDRGPEFLHSLRRLYSPDASSYLRTHLTALKALYFLKNHQWEEAQHLLEANRPSGDSFAPLLQIARKGVQLPRKSPVVAGLLSAVIPGSGKIYAGRTFDGLYSFLIVGGTAWLAYEGFRDRGVSGGKGWIFGTAAAFFHLGNIYGSVSAARLANTLREEKLDREIHAQISIWTYF